MTNMISYQGLVRTFLSVGMVLAIICHRQNMKTSIINGSEVSK
uniref:Uncharacterized protein n=2 Tax=Klebsiella TaxID=570 RepID=A0A345WXL3_KLEOX|nr:hypothetical protein [Klebsiella oxytoca]AXJ98763.1 hypothetical protein [Klebsiella pneumoniae]